MVKEQNPSKPLQIELNSDQKKAVVDGLLNKGMATFDTLDFDLLKSLYPPNTPMKVIINDLSERKVILK